ncbi:MAG: methylmalonyl Co-A mutase-associated GTPase MeaB [Deltaproteobacteria bacterium]|nr:methylmalonyl Co-A mutase-associated GTPase MeaB [Deltaproteobacteria bacterium]
MKPGDIKPYIDGVMGRNRRMVAKTITLIESAHIAHKEMARSIVDKLLPHAGNAIRLGITGVPGAGKSTFIDTLGMMLVEDGRKVAVLAVDPSSVVTGGSILADKTRMERLSVHKDAFIRPSPSGGTLGGVASKTRETMLILEAAGFDVVIVETVGAGQSEVAVASMVDFFLVLMIAGAGDELQGIKKGILELADAVAVNKADGDNILKANLAKYQYETALHYSASPSPHWSPPVVTCSATESTGIREIWNIVTAHREKLSSVGALEMKRKRQSLDWMWFLIKEGLTESFYKNPQVKNMLPRMEREVLDGAASPITAAEKLLSCLNER